MSPDHLRDPIERRTFMERCARYAFGLTILSAFNRNTLAATDAAAAATPISRTPAFGKAKRVIFIELQGGLSHIDSFDPKTGDIKGPGNPIPTNAGYQVTQYLPEIAKIANKITVIRSMTAKVGVHANAQYLMRTGFEKRGTIVHPMLGAWAQHYLGKSHPTLPSTVCVNRPANHGNGYFPAAFSPLPILDPDQGLANADPGISADIQTKRLGLLAQLDSTFSTKSTDENVKAYSDFYDTTMALMKSTDLKAFDITAEPAAVRDSYGRTKFGQGCLLARRLVENGVRFVEVQSGGWDMHKQLADGMEERGGEFDRTFAALVSDLDSRGLLDSTLVAVTTEFGRKPSFDGGGRGHHPLVFSTALAGGGVKRGYVHGKSDEKAYEPDDKPMTVGSFHATIAYAAGLPIEQEMITPSGRPMTVGNKGKPAMEIFA